MNLRNLRSAIILLFGAGVFYISDASAETLIVKVVDFTNTNTGVPSNISIFDEKNQKIVSGPTNTDGVFTENHKCMPAHQIVAEPVGRGEFLSSGKKRCQQELVLPVLRRETPFGLTFFSGQVKDIILPDGSSGAIAYRAFLFTQKRDQSILGSFAKSCNVTVHAYIKQQVFKTSGVYSESLGEKDVPLSALVTKLGTEDANSAIFPFGCAVASENIQTLENATAGKIEKIFASNQLSAKMALQNLGIECPACPPEK
jgi:hypothetical protein